MKKTLLSLLLMFLSVGVFAQETPSVAVFYKLLTNEQTSLSPLVAEISSKLKDKYTLVSRMEEFQALVDKEIIYQSTGRVDEEKLAALGKEFNADYVCAILVEFNEPSNEYFYFAELISVQNRDVKHVGDANASNLSIKSQQAAAASIWNKMFPPVKPTPRFTRRDLLYNDGVDVCSGNAVYEDYQVIDLLSLCDDKRAVELYVSGLKRKKASKWFYGIGGSVFVVGALFHIGWSKEDKTYETVKKPLYKTDGVTVIGIKHEKVLRSSTRWHAVTQTAVVLTAIGAGTLITGAILSAIAKNNVGTALNIYNREIKGSGVYSPSWTINATPSGIGLCLRF